jgi:hypothetical protein
VYMEKWEASSLTTGGRSRGSNNRNIRSETISMRLEPRIRYLAELGARKDRRSLSSFIETAIEAALSQVGLVDSDGINWTLGEVGPRLWDPFVPDRFVKLAIRFPDLLNHHEQIVWKLVKENGLLWRGGHRNETEEWVWKVQESSMMWERLRDHWLTFNAVANEDLPASALPTWRRYPAGDPRNVAAKGTVRKESPDDNAPMDDEDIPF